MYVYECCVSRQRPLRQDVVQRSPTECGVSECESEVSTMRSTRAVQP
jgi:hypothetical protein